MYKDLADGKYSRYCRDILHPQSLEFPKDHFTYVKDSGAFRENLQFSQAFCANLKDPWLWHRLYMHVPTFSVISVI